MASHHKAMQVVMDLDKHIDKKIRIKFAGGREVVGTLKGFDQLTNIVLDDTTEILLGADEASSTPPATRYLGLLVCRGPTITVVCPDDGLQEIANPFLQGDDEADAAAGQ